MLKIYRKIFIILLVVCLLFPHLADGAFEFKEAGVRGAALAGAYTAVSDDVEAIWWNPAGLRFCRGIEVNTTYTNLYGMSDLSYLNFAFVLPTLTAGTWGLGYSSFGPKAYKETDLRLSFATELGGGIYLGTNLKSNTVTIGSEGGSAGAFGVDIGVTANISEKLRMAVSAININGPTLGDTAEMLESRFLIGFQAKPYEGLSASLDLQKPLEKELELRVGFEFMLNESFALRTGVQTIPSRFTFGFGYEWAIFSLNYAFLTHTVLASQHMFSLKMKFGEKEVRRRVQYERHPVRKKKFGGVVNINTADVRELSRLAGIGKVAAKKIIEYREQSGEFRSIKEIMNIYGFTKTRYDKIRDHITVGEVKKKPRKREEQPEREEILPKRMPVEEYDEPPEPEPEIELEPEPEPELEPEPEPELKVKPAPDKVEKRRININEANVGEIDKISGVSATLARNIVRFRKTRGRFKNWNQLLRVPGMNHRILENMKNVGTLK